MSEQTHSALEHFPITFFTTVMGMSGLTLALHAGERALGLTDVTSSVALAATVALFVVVALTYAAKALRYPAAVAAEWNHPVKLAFFPAVSISLLLMATAMLGRFPGVAQGMWLVGMLLQGLLTVLVVTGWISTRSFVHGHLSPAWFIPAVGNVIVPIAGAQMGYIEISWYFMSIGLIFWVVLLTLVMNRLIFHDPLPERLQPTLVILIAPPAVGFLAWLRLNGGVIDSFAHILLNAAYFFTLLVAVQLPRILKLPFAMSFWALSFPVAAVTIASFAHAGVAQSGFHQMLGMVLLAGLIVIIAALIVRTARAVIAGAVFQPE